MNHWAGDAEGVGGEPLAGVAEESAVELGEVVELDVELVVGRPDLEPRPGILVVAADVGERGGHVEAGAVSGSAAGPLKSAPPPGGVPSSPTASVDRPGPARVPLKSAGCRAAASASRSRAERSSTCA